MSNHDMNLQLFAISDKETLDNIKAMTHTMRTDMEFWHDWEFAATGAFQAAFLKGIEADVSEIMREGGTQSCIMRDCSNHLKEIASSLKSINESLRLIAGRME